MRPTLIGMGLASALALGALTAHAYDTDPDIQALKSQGAGFSKVAAKVKPAVVFIEVETQGVRPSALGQDDLLERFFGPRFRGQRRGPQHGPAPFGGKGQGSGFLIDGDGTIVTNNHVVEHAQKITVRLTDGRRFQAKVLGTDPQTDLAVIDIDGDHLPTVAVGRSGKLSVGEWVMAVGNPFGLSHSVTVGVVSATGRAGMGITDYEDFIQTDAAINPGNSGGPLVNMDGEVMGINTAIFSRSGGSMGIGFAIPVDMAKPIIDQLKEGEAVRRGFLGVVVQPLDPVFAEQFGLDADTRGVLIGGVSHDSAAAKAGVEPGDVVVGLNGQKVEDVNRFRNKVAMFGPGRPVELDVLREGKRQTLTVTLDERPSDPRAQAKAGPADGAEAFGLAVAPLTRSLARKFDLKARGGLVITEIEPGSPAARAGLKPGLRIVTVGRKPVATVREFQRALRTGKDAVVLRVENEEGSRFVVLRKR